MTMCSNSVGIVSNKTILSRHPFVDDPEAEAKQIEKERKEQDAQADPYGGGFGWQER